MTPLAWLLLTPAISLGLAVGLLAFAAALIWPRRWERIAGTLSIPPVLVFWTVMTTALLTEPDNDGGHVAAAAAGYLVPLLVLYIATVWSGAWTARLMRQGGGAATTPTGTG